MRKHRFKLGIMMLLSILLFGSSLCADTYDYIEAMTGVGKGDPRLRKGRLPDPPPGPNPAGAYQVFANNDSGMHCIDSDYSIWAILPPGNFLLAQVFRKGSEPAILGQGAASLTYRGTRDPMGSINTYSTGKTNFWTYVAAMFGVSLAPDTGFLGQKMPGRRNTPQPFMYFEAETTRFLAAGIPITPIDDSGNVNSYPLMQVDASVGGTVVSSVSTVIPVSTEMHCSDCHATGKVAATVGFRGVTQWSTIANIDLQTRQNVAILHDAVYDTNLIGNLPISCASCHYSAANDLEMHGALTGSLSPSPKPGAGNVSSETLSMAMHWRHGSAQGTALNQVPIPNQGIATCYECHPGRTTQCFRGAMFTAGMKCQDCHGTLLSVAGLTANKTPVVLSTTTGNQRRPWIDLPLCQSCHVGDAVDPGGTFILRQAYDPLDAASASPRIASNKRFAEPNAMGGLPMLFKSSTTHNGAACESCHGSPHAIWPTNQVNDNITAIQIQGHTGQISECVACHGSSFNPIDLDGPHGLHVVNSNAFVNGHESLAEGNLGSCQTCHGQMLQGTVISKAQATRTFTVEERGTVTIAKGVPVSCSLCHENPLNGGD